MIRDGFMVIVRRALMEMAISLMLALGLLSFVLVFALSN
tara:strand:- start:25 stop:141 length:117 start_codon:yes stop_codon:yes gene_type:complete